MSNVQQFGSIYAAGTHPFLAPSIGPLLGPRTAHWIYISEYITEYTVKNIYYRITSRNIYIYSIYI